MNPDAKSESLLPSRQAAPLRVLDGFGGSMRSACRTLTPSSTGELAQMLARADELGLPVALRGAGRSYGDAALGSEGLVVDTSGLAQILNWDAENGIAEVEPGVSMAQLWRRALPDSYWPAVVPGTMAPTLGGCAAMNVHGKNQFKVGVFGEHVRDFELITARGETVRASREENPEIFHAALGGAGMLGAFSRLSLRLKKVESGRMRVESIPVGSFAEQFETMEAQRAGADYLVTWIDCIASGNSLGRGQIHVAHHLHGSEDPLAKQSLQISEQELPARIFGFPKSQLWRMMRPFFNDFGIRWTNFGKYIERATCRPRPHLSAIARGLRIPPRLRARLAARLWPARIVATPALRTRASGENGVSRSAASLSEARRAQLSRRDEAAQGRSLPALARRRRLVACARFSHQERWRGRAAQGRERGHRSGARRGRTLLSRQRSAARAAPDRARLWRSSRSILRAEGEARSQRHAAERSGAETFPERLRKR